jgi:hypothetical protein
MKIEKLNVVNDLMKVRKCCKNALEEANKFMVACEKDELRQGEHIEDTKVFQGQYNGFLGKYKDGSGDCVVLTGCYVTKQVLLATMIILGEQIETIEADLKELGVEV